MLWGSIIQHNNQEWKQYTSAEVELNDTPPITDIYATYTKDLPIGEGLGGIQIFLDTEDPTGKTQYYRWEFKRRMR